MRWRAAVAVAVLGLMALPLAAQAAASGVRVKPPVGWRTTHFVVSFTAPNAAGLYGALERHYSVVATGPMRSGCQSSAARNVQTATQGQRVRVKFVPHPHWCRGTYRGTIDELSSPLCMPVHVCPMFVSTVLEVGHFKFKVR